MKQSSKQEDIIIYLIRKSDNIYVCVGLERWGRFLKYLETFCKFIWVGILKIFSYSESPIIR